MKQKPKSDKKKLMKVSTVVHRRLKLRAADVGTDMGRLLEKETAKWRKYDIEKK